MTRLPVWSGSTHSISRLVGAKSKAKGRGSQGPRAKQRCDSQAPPCRRSRLSSVCLFPRPPRACWWIPRPTVPETLVVPSPLLAVVDGSINTPDGRGRWRHRHVSSQADPLQKTRRSKATRYVIPLEGGRVNITQPTKAKPYFSPWVYFWPPWPWPVRRTVPDTRLAWTSNTCLHVQC